MKRIIYTQDNGILAVIIPSPEWNGTIEELAARDVSEGKTFKIVDADKIPNDRSFRAAWEEGTIVTPVKINMNKARNIHMDRIRVSRDDKLSELDTEEMLARRGGHPQGKTEQDVWNEKQALLDLPQSFDLSGATTPKELKALCPSELQ